MSAFDIRAITAFRQSGDRRQTQRLSGQAALAEEIADSQKRDHGFLALLGDDGLLDLAALNVENGIRRIALPEYDLILPIIGNGVARRLPSRETLWDRTGALLCRSLPALLIARGILRGGSECVAKGMVRKRQIGIGHQLAFTHRLSEIQWSDFAHGGSWAPSDGRAHPRQQEYDPAGEATPPPTPPASLESNSVYGRCR